MATYTISTRNTDSDPWDARYEIDDPVGLLDVTNLSFPVIQPLMAAGENQIQCKAGMVVKYTIKKL